MRVDPLTLNIGAEIEGWYGTKVSTIILVRKDGFVQYLERDIWMLDAEGHPIHGSRKDDRRNCFWLYL